MAIVRKITRRPVPLGSSSSNNVDDDDAVTKKEQEQEKEKVEKSNYDVNEVVEEQASASTSPLYNMSSPINANWEGLMSTISSIGKYTFLIEGSTLASKANQTIDQIYEIANASSPLELDKAQSQTRRSSSGRNASVDYLNDLEDLKNKLKPPVITISSDDKVEKRVEVIEKKEEVIQKREDMIEKREGSPVKGIQGKKPSAFTNKKKSVVKKEVNTKSNEKESTENEIDPKEVNSKEVESKGIEANESTNESTSEVKNEVKNEEPNEELNNRNNQMGNMASAIGSIGKTVMSRMSKARDLYASSVVTYSSTEDVALADLFTRFGGQAALTRLQLASSEAARAYKKHLKSLKPAQSKSLTAQAGEIESMFEPEHLMESVILLDESEMMKKKGEFEEIVECLGREREASGLYARQHFAHLTALACQALDPQKPPQASFSLIIGIISELQLLLSQYEEQSSDDNNNTRLLCDANECIKLLTEAAYQLVPIYKNSLINTN